MRATLFRISWLATGSGIAERPSRRTSPIKRSWLDEPRRRLGAAGRRATRRAPDGGCSREVDAGAPEHTRDGVSGQGSAATGPQSGAVPGRPVGDAEAARKQPRLTGPREAPGVADPVKADMPELPVTRRQFIRVPQR
jgi:hypothetical protein